MARRLSHLAVAIGILPPSSDSWRPAHTTPNLPGPPAKGGEPAALLPSAAIMIHHDSRMVSRSFLRSSGGQTLLALQKPSWRLRDPSWWRRSCCWRLLVWREQRVVMALKLFRVVQTSPWRRRSVSWGPNSSLGGSEVCLAHAEFVVADQSSSWRRTPPGGCGGALAMRSAS